MRFEWDEKKAERNIRKHGISFIDSIEAFTDIYGLDLFDAEHSQLGENRFIRIGLAYKDVLLVVYVVRDENSETFRIVSARKAGKNYESIYWNQRTQN